MADATRGRAVLDGITGRGGEVRPLNVASAVLAGIARPPVNGADFIASFKAPEFLWDGVLTRGSLAAMTAHTGMGKTGLAVPMALHCATGRDLAGLAMQGGKVAYVAAENSVDVQARVVGAAQHYGIEHDELRDSLFVYEGPRGVDLLRGQMRELAEREGDLALVIIDTSAAVYQGDDENSNVDMQRHAEGLREITFLPGRPTVLALMHPRHGALRDSLLPRGGSAMIAALDTNLTLWKGDDDTLHLHYTKLRGAPFDPLLFDLKRVELVGYADSRGRPVTAGIAVPTGADDGELKRRTEHVDADNLVLRILASGAYESMSKVAARCGWLDGRGSPAKWKAQRSIDRLEADRLVQRYRDGYRLTKAGERELAQLGGIG